MLLHGMENIFVPYPAETISPVFIVRPDNLNVIFIFQNIQTQISLNNKGCDVSRFHLAHLDFVILCEYLVPISNNLFIFYCFIIQWISGLGREMVCAATFTSKSGSSVNPSCLRWKLVKLASAKQKAKRQLWLVKGSHFLKSVHMTICTVHRGGYN